MISVRSEVKIQSSGSPIIVGKLWVIMSILSNRWYIRPQTEEKMVSRLLCLNQTSDRSTSSWVGDHQRILIAVYLCFTFVFFYGSLRLFLECTIWSFLLHNGQNQEPIGSELSRLGTHVWTTSYSYQSETLIINATISGALPIGISAER